VSFGKTLRGVREAAGLSQTQLAARASVSIDSLRNWEQDRVLPKIDAVTKLARALDVSLDRFAVEPAEDLGAVEEAPPARRGKGRKPKGK
jgi:transcriptional regulator with XRE-family HTH domain